MDNDRYAILLAGGEGSRFWPLSRTLEPKQLLSLNGEKSFFENTISRLGGIIPGRNIFIVTSGLYKQQIGCISSRYGIPARNIIPEPGGKSTAPSIGLACRLISRACPEAKVIVLPCDHHISGVTVFKKILKGAFESPGGNIILFGIEPHRPATGYGYIKTAGSKRAARGGYALPVAGFFEKPDLKKAKQYLRQKAYLWNSGIVLASAKTILREIDLHMPDLGNNLKRIRSSDDIQDVWPGIKSVSFDRGILEKSRNIRAIPLPANSGWSDLGTWDSLDETMAKDESGNILKGDVIDRESKNITVLGGKRLIATIDLEGLIIVDTPDALLITRKGSSEKVRAIVDALHAKGREECCVHKTVKKIWGGYTLLDSGDGFKIKTLDIRPGHAISLQYHKHRSEHWVVIAGSARVIKGREISNLRVNQGIYIPVRCVHKIFNPGKATLRIAEVQLGTKVAEDDIVRLDTALS